MPGMNPQRLSWLEIPDHQFAREFEPGYALSAELLQQEAVSAEDSGAERLLEADADLNLLGRAKKPVTVNEIFLRWTHLNRHNVPRHLRGEGKFSGKTRRAILRHEQGSAAGHALQDAEDSAASAKLRMRGHLDRTRHPGKFSGFGNDGIVRFENEFEYGHGGAGDAALHDGSFSSVAMTVLVGWCVEPSCRSQLLLATFPLKPRVYTARSTTAVRKLGMLRPRSG